LDFKLSTEREKIEVKQKELEGTAMPILKAIADAEQQRIEAIQELKNYCDSLKTYISSA